MSHQENNHDDEIFEKFPKPRTVPMNWDVSGLTTSKVSPQEDQTETEEIFEKFPKPRTMPINWDTSELHK